MAPKICVSIATSDVQSLKEQVGRAIELGADFVEVRFDFVRPEDLPAAVDTVRDAKGRAVFTLRSKAQGGRFAGSEQDRIKWLKKLAEQRPMLLDVELDTVKENDELADFFDESKTPILVSWHDFEETPPSDEIADILSEMRIYSNYVKVVTTAKSIEDSLRLLEIYEGTLGLNPVIFAMGEAGVISRIMCTLVGNAPFTYASLDNAVAPGQLTVLQMKKLYGRMQ